MLWRYGPGCWPGVLLGSLAALLAGGHIPPAAALVLALGNTGSAIVGVGLLRRLTHFDPRLQRLDDVVALSLVAAIAPVVSATADLAVMQWIGRSGTSAAGHWLAAWSGAFLGVLVTGPVLLVWLTGGIRRPEWRQLGEALALGTLILAGGWAVYAGPLPRPSLLYPLVLWAALRFDLRGATLASAAVALTAVWATAAGSGPLVHSGSADTALALEIIVAVTMVLGLVTASVTAERRDATESLRAVFNAAPLAIVAVDGEGRVTRWNDGAERMFGWKRSEVLGRPAPYLPDERRAELVELVLRQRQGERIVGFETVRLHRSGRPLPVSLSLASLRDGRGRITGSIALIEDVGPRRLEQTRLRESEARLNTALESLPFDFWICDDQGRCVVQNSASIRRWGRQLGGAPAHAAAGRAAADRWEDHHRRAFAGEVVEGEVEYRLPDGDHHFYTVVAPIRSGEEIRGTLGCQIDVTERRQAEAALAQQKEILQTIFDHVPVMISCLGPDGGVRWVNRCWQDRLGWTPEQDLMAELCADPEDLRRAGEMMRSADSRWADFRVRTRSGELLDSSWAAVRLSDGTTIAIGQDVSQRKEAERALRTSEVQLRQSQKMEAVGRLAGGVAHDFNNLLTSILGHTELLLAEMTPDDDRREDIAEIRHAAERAADLTSQLLAFSRKQVIVPKVLDLNEVIGRIAGMLGRLIGEPIALTTVLEPTLGRVLADPGQIEQVLVNLVVNARDAMPDGGRLRIETDNVVLDEAFAQRYEGAVPGPHVMLGVIDEGVGMDAEVQSHMFEPFFTTKDKAKGTGLGLATVYGIVKQSGGYIAVESAPGAGTAMRIYLPLAAVMPLPEAPPRPERSTRGSETVLLVEDEHSVRGLTRRILAKAGYTVLSAPDAHEALRVSAEYQSRIDLLLTDVIMSGPSGPRLAETLSGLRPDLAVLFMSGYNEDTIVRQGVLRPGVAYLQKPFTPAGLLRRVRDTLDRRPAPGRAAV